MFRFDFIRSVVNIFISIFTKIQKISNDNKDLVGKSLGLLCNEFKRAPNVAFAINANIINVLTATLYDDISFLYPTLIQNLLRCLHILSFNIDGLKLIANNKSLMKKLFRLIILEQFKKNASLAAEILLSVSLSPQGW